MENQHREIKGYRELSQEEIDMMNKIKQKGVELAELVNDLQWVGAGCVSSDGQEPDNRWIKPDNHWVQIGSDHLQQGLMALTRSVAKPDFF